MRNAANAVIFSSLHNLISDKSLPAHAVVPELASQASVGHNTLTKGD